MTTLDTLQRVFQDYLCNPNNLHIETLTAEGNLLPKTEQLLIYFNAYRLRLLEILTLDFPILSKLMGEEAFEACGLSYIESHPSQYFSVRYFSQHLPLFLQQTKPYADRPLLAELATFESILNDTLDAADSNILEIKALQTILPEQWGYLQFSFHPSLRFMLFEWNTPQLFQAIEANQPPPDPLKLPEAIHWIAWRYELKSRYRSLSDTQYFMLKSLYSGRTFAELCEDLCQKMEVEDIPKTALGFIQQCIHDQLISKFSIHQ